MHVSLASINLSGVILFFSQLFIADVYVYQIPARQLAPSLKAGQPHVAISQYRRLQTNNNTCIGFGYAQSSFLQTALRFLYAVIASRINGSAGFLDSGAGAGIYIWTTNKCTASKNK